MKTILVGAKGKMGKILHDLLIKKGHEVFPIDKGDSFKINSKFDVVIDFSDNDAFCNVFELCKNHKIPLVCGTTNLSEENQKKLEILSTIVSVVFKNNFSIGVNTFKKLLDFCNEELVSWDKEMIEIHKKDKKDSPSGTAKLLNENLHCNIHSLRIGNVVGKHCVIFSSQSESITIIHEAENREVFALGAIEQAEKLVQANTNLTS